MTRNISNFWLFIAGVLTLLAATPAVAHVLPGSHPGGFHAGFVHPWLGLDHLLAMVAVGLLAVRADSKQALWLIPAGFVCGMLIGGFAAYAALPVPGVELAIATSVIVLGLMLAFLPKVKTLPMAALVGFAGFFHGHAHITEMTGSVAGYIIGMVLATALLHAVGVFGGSVLSRIRTIPLTRYAGATMAGVFAVTLVI